MFSLVFLHKKYKIDVYFRLSTLLFFLRIKELCIFARWPDGYLYLSEIQLYIVTMDYTKIVGEKIKSLREAKTISIAELATRSGLSEDQVERIESNTDLPSLAPLIKIARALGVRLGTFLDDQPHEQGPVVCRRKEATGTISFSNNAVQTRRHMQYHSLSKSKTDRHMEPFLIDVEANGETSFTLSSHEGEEFIMVLKGVMEINYGKNTYVLEEGDSIYYDSIVPHHVHAFEGQAAQILAVVYTPF